jgi:uncharacterized protein (TIGR00369 family)
MTTPAAAVHQDELDRFAAAFSSGVMMRAWGFRISFPRGEHVLLELPEVRDHHRGGMGTAAVNGGVLAAMADFALGCTTVLSTPMRKNATIQLSITFERPTRGDSIRCEARLEATTKSVNFASARVFDAAGNLCARASAVVSLGPEESLAQWGLRLAAPTPGDAP